MQVSIPGNPQKGPPSSAPAAFAGAGYRAPNTPQSARCRKWASQRKQAVSEASRRRDLRLAQDGVLLPLVPHRHGYQVPMSARSGTSSCPFGLKSDDTSAPGQCRLKQLHGLYEPPVWHEVFGSSTKLAQADTAFKK